MNEGEAGRGPTESPARHAGRLRMLGRTGLGRSVVGRRVRG